MLNETSREIYPFTVTHLNQKQPKQQLVAWASDRTMTTAYRQQILRALDAKLAISQLLQQVSQPFNQTFDLNAAQPSPLSQAAFQQRLSGASASLNTRSATSNCAQDQHVAALKAALDPQYKTFLQKGIEKAFIDQLYARGLNQSLQNALKEFNLSSVGVSAVSGDPKLQITWEHPFGDKYVVQVYAKQGLPEQQESRVVWRVSFTENGTIDVGLNQHASSIDNMRLTDLLHFPEQAEPLKMSSCLAQELANHSPKTKIDAATQAQIDRYDELGNDVIGSDDVHVRSGSVCQSSYYDRRGEIMTKFLTLCPADLPQN